MNEINVICGLHRSGTTFVGRILQHVKVAVVHEPLNERFGMADVPIAYPYAEMRDDTFAALLNDAVNFARPWNKDPSFVRAGGIKRLAFSLTGGRSGLKWRGLRFRRCVGLLPKRICLKDPFMSLATPWLVRQRGASVVCMVRHPAAIHYSTEKQNWSFDVENLLRQPELIERYGKDIPKAHWQLAREHRAASIAILWKLMVRINRRLAQSDKRLQIITHESLCQLPIETAKRICSHFELQFTLELERYVSAHSKGARVEARDGRTHDFKRNSRAIPDVWRGKLTAVDEQLIADIAGEEILQVYAHK